MTYVVGLVALLVLLAGIIAYAGDRLGTWVGRRRLTLFGWRPRRTGQVVGVAAGILIMLTTIGVLAIAFRNATQTLVNAQRTADELSGLRNQERFLQNQLGELRSSLTVLQTDLAEAELVIEEAEATRDQALADRDALLEEAEATRLELEVSRDAVATAQAELATVESQLLQAESDRAQAEAEAEAARVEAQTARADAQAALEEVAGLEAQLEQVQASLQLADVRLLQLDVQLSEVGAALEAADTLRRESEEAAALAEQAQLVAEAATVAAEAAASAALADRDAAIAQREDAQAQLEGLETRTMELGRQLSALSAEVEELEAASTRLVEQAAQLQQENTGLQARNDQLVSSNQDLVDRNESLQELNASLQAQILSGNETVRQLEGQLEGLQDRLDDQARRLTEMQQEFARATSGEITFERDQVVFSGALHAADLNAAREELAAFVRQASAHTARLGAGEVVLSADQFNSLVEVIIETEGSDLVRLISPRNQFNPVRVEVVIEALENTRLYQTGQLLFSRPVHVGSSELPTSPDDLRAWTTQLRSEAIRYLRRAGLDELQAPVFVGLSDESFVNQLLRLNGLVVVGVMARDAIDRAGPAEIEFIILY